MTNLSIAMVLFSLQLLAILAGVILFSERLRGLWPRLRLTPGLIGAATPEAAAAQRLARLHAQVYQLYLSEPDFERQAALRLAVESLRRAAQALACGEPGAMAAANQALLDCGDSLTHACAPFPPA